MHVRLQTINDSQAKLINLNDSKHRFLFKLEIAKEQTTLQNPRVVKKKKIRVLWKVHGNPACRREFFYFTTF